MNNVVTIIMYHYVRDLKHSRFPSIKGLDLSLFKEQISFIKKKYQPISMEFLIDSIQNNQTLPKNAALLTFDDGYIDHFNHVFPILLKNNIQGAFYPPVSVTKHHKLLDVNKIHYILATNENTHQIIDELKKLLLEYKEEYQLQNFDQYYNILAIESRFDNKDIIFIKRLLQRELPENCRNEMTSYLFKKFVYSDEETFAREIYMNSEQLECMVQNGMHIGSHGQNHYWLGNLNYSDQLIDLENSILYLHEIGVNQDYLSVCYPYGSFNSDTLNICNNLNFKVGLTTQVEIADLKKHAYLTLPRLDTNDILKISHLS
jgi:peptidoglycan/xylan/chitin deacetylase (PgdA/CDA1 family)